MHNFNFPTLMTTSNDNADVNVYLARVKDGKVVKIASDVEQVKDMVSGKVGDSYFCKVSDKKILVINVGLEGVESKVEELIAKALAELSDNVESINLNLSGESDIDYHILASELMVKMKTGWTLKGGKKNAVSKTVSLDCGCSSIKSGVVLGQVKSWVQKMVSMPSNYLTPVKFEKEIQDFLAENKLEGLIDFQAHGQDWVLNEKMGSFYGVAKGSSEELRFMELSYKGGKLEDKPIVLVGKGITFDTGGISLKPSKGMGDMKGDMAGAASAIASIFYAAMLKLPLNVITLAPCCENMPSGNAVKPGDVLVAKNGKTIEVVNTDAEGRLVLADALVYAQKFNGKYVIDMATLTGACITAIGYEYTGLFTEDDELGTLILESGGRAKDWAWHLPMDSDLHKGMLKSAVADMSNSSEGAQGAGATNGAIFLKEFAPETGWAHLDIAGVSEVRGSGNPTGRPVGLIANMLNVLANEAK